MTANVITSAAVHALPVDPEPCDGANQSPHIQLIQMAAAIWKARAVYAAARLALADHIAAGCQTAEELARATGMHEASLYRLLRALASSGVFTEIAPGRFALTP